MPALVWQHRLLLFQLVRRDVLLRYRGALFGLLWVLLSPLLLLAIFAFVFGEIFGSRWPEQASTLPIWLMLYTGLVVFNVFSDTVSRASMSVREYPSYTKKMIFPVEILPLVPLGVSLVHGFFNLGLLALYGEFTAGFFWYPVLILPVLLLAAGLSWFLSALGVFVKDMVQVVPLLVQMALFLSPVLYPVSAVPEFLRPFYLVNPIGSVIEAARAAVIGQDIPWSSWSVALLIGILAFVAGITFFRQCRDEFPDVL